MNIKTLKILKKWAHMQIPSKHYANIVIEQFELMTEKEQKATLKEIKMQILLHSN